MKKFLTVLILVFMLQTPSLADDIRDFQIQGISLGDSLSKHFSNEEIENFFKEENAVNYYPGSKKFFSLATFAEVNQQIYDQEEDLLQYQQF